MKVKRTENGPHPLEAGDRIWKAGEEGEMSISEALPRIEHGLFVAADPAEHVAALEEQMAMLRAADVERNSPEEATPTAAEPKKEEDPEN